MQAFFVFGAGYSANISLQKSRLIDRLQAQVEATELSLTRRSLLLSG